MSLRSTARALPTMMRVGAQEALAYRAELLVWIISTTLPLVMLALFSAVSREAPIGRYGPGEITLYFLVTFGVRQLTGSWVAWQMNLEVREGKLSLRLLRPVSPVVSYAVENLSALPLRVVVALPLAVAAVAVAGGDRLPRDPALWAVFGAGVVGAWLLTFLSNLAVGCLSLYLGQSVALVDVWLLLYMVLSGYTIPVDLFPGWLRAASQWLPFRYQMAFPVEVLAAPIDRGAALALLGRQWAMAAALGLLTWALWRRGLRRFEAYGG